MGIFPDYTKAGPGVDKNAPKRRGIFLYFELLGRYIWKVMTAGMLFTAISIPVLAIYHYLFLCVFGTIYGAEASLSDVNHSALVFTVLLTILWGTGPASCGLTYLLRGIAREEHIWVSLDFFKTARQSFKHGIIFLLVDIFVFVITMFSISVYSGYAEQKGWFYLIPVAIIIVGLFIYTLMHFFMYEFEITFENKVKDIYKNSLLMAIAHSPMCVLLGGIICFLAYILLGSLTGMGIVLISFLIWVVAMRFVIDFYVARVIKRDFLKEVKESEE